MLRLWSQQKFFWGDEVENFSLELPDESFKQHACHTDNQLVRTGKHLDTGIYCVFPEAGE